MRLLPREERRLRTSSVSDNATHRVLRTDFLRLDCAVGRSTTVSISSAERTPCTPTPGYLSALLYMHVPSAARATANSVSCAWLGLAQMFGRARSASCGSARRVVGYTHTRRICSTTSRVLHGAQARHARARASSIPCVCSAGGQRSGRDLLRLPPSIDATRSSRVTSDCVTLTQRGLKPADR